MNQYLTVPYVVDYHNMGRLEDIDLSTEVVERFTEIHYHSCVGWLEVVGGLMVLVRSCCCSSSHGVLVAVLPMALWPSSRLLCGDC